MNDSIFDYWSRREAADHFGLSITALKKQEEAAAEAGIGLSENFVQKSNTRFWHKDEWNRIRSAKLQKYIDEAIELGLVVTTARADEDLIAEYDRGYRCGYDNGHKAATDKFTAEIPVVDNTHELNELEDVNTTGYIAGGFQPLSALGL